MEQLIEILTNLKDTVDYTKEKHLISDGIIESIDIVMIISDIEEKFGIEVGFEYIEKANFESVDTMMAMIEAIKAEG